MFNIRILYMYICDFCQIILCIVPKVFLIGLPINILQLLFKYWCWTCLNFRFDRLFSIKSYFNNLISILFKIKITVINKFLYFVLLFHLFWVQAILNPRWMPNKFRTKDKIAQSPHFFGSQTFLFRLMYNVQNVSLFSMYFIDRITFQICSILMKTQPITVGIFSLKTRSEIKLHLLFG